MRTLPASSPSLEVLLGYKKSATSGGHPGPLANQVRAEAGQSEPSEAHPVKNI